MSCQDSSQAASTRALQIPVRSPPERRCERELQLSGCQLQDLGERWGPCVVQDPCLVMFSGQLLPERGMPSYKSRVTTPQMNRGITRNQPGHQLSLQHTLSPKTYNTVHFSACSFQPLPMIPACQPPYFHFLAEAVPCSSPVYRVNSFSSSRHNLLEVT